MLKFLLAALIYFSFSTCFAQSDSDPYHLEQTGKLFTIKIVPGDKKTSVYLAGKKAAQIQWNDLNIEATLGDETTTNVENKKIIFTRAKKKNQFVYEGGLKGQTLKLELKSKKAPEEPIDKFYFKVRP